MFEENKENKQQLKEATSTAESLQSELSEANKAKNLRRQKMDEYDLANKRFQETVIKKTNQIKDRSEVEKLIKPFQNMRIEINIQRAEAIQLIQVVDGKQFEKLQKKFTRSLDSRQSLGLERL